MRSVGRSVQGTQLNSISSLTYQVTSARTRPPALRLRRCGRLCRRRRCGGGALPGASPFAPLEGRKAAAAPDSSSPIVRSLPSEQSLFPCLPRRRPSLSASLQSRGAAPLSPSRASSASSATEQLTPLRSSNPSLSSISSSPSPSGTDRGKKATQKSLMK